MRLCLLVACLFVTCLAGHVQAQRVPGYLRQNTVTPYLNLYRGESGGINNYFGLVRPMQNQLRLNQSQAVENRYLQQQLQGTVAIPGQGGTASRTQGLMMGPGQAGAMSGPRFRQNATSMGQQPKPAASYFNYLQFYNMPAGGFRRTR